MIDDKMLTRWSAPYRGWHYHPDHVIPAQPTITGFDDVHMVDVPTVYQLPGEDRWYMSFIGFDGKGYQSFVAESDDLVDWGTMRLAMGYGKEGEFDFGGRVIGAFLYDDYGVKARRTLKKKDGKYWTLYGAYPRQGGYELRPGYEGVACSEDGLAWRRSHLGQSIPTRSTRPEVTRPASTGNTPTRSHWSGIRPTRHTTCSTTPSATRAAALA